MTSTATGETTNERTAEPRTGVLLINLGTPEAPDTASVRRYLREFLGDPAVLPLPGPARWALLNLIILPFRPRRSAAAYQKIWSEDGSPLLVAGQELQQAVAKRLGDGFQVELAMRYGTPSLREGVERLTRSGVDRIVALPLFPQFSDATTGSIRTLLDELLAEQARAGATPTLEWIEDFYAAPGFLDAQAARAREALHGFDAEHLLMSFHGLPEKMLRDADPSGAHCLAAADCCARIGEVNRRCYRAQCFATAQGLAQRLDLPAGAWSLSFQSRLGRGWTQPFTDTRIEELAKEGKKRIAVVCPAFVADCLETLEEIGIQAREQFEAQGGETLRLIPCVNADYAFADAIASWVRVPAERPS